MAKLNERQCRFAEEYLIDYNATQAALRAGYAKKSAATQAHDLLKNPKIQSLILKGSKRRSEQTGIDAAWLLKRLADEADADIADLYDENGILKPVDQWPDIWRKGLVQGIDVENEYIGRGENREKIGTVTKIRVSDRVKRLELIGKHINVGAFSEKLELSGNLTLESILETAKKKGEEGG